MKILIAISSRHRSTDEIGVALTSTLRERGFDVERRAPELVTDLAGYDAVIVGSAVYIGRWLEPARAFVERHAEALRRMPVWLLSSGPLGEPPHPIEEPADVRPLMDLIDARGHQVFAGELEKGDLGLGERAIVTVVRAPTGDFRDWPAIRVWAMSIADSLSQVGARS
jgi:menaquinone-dependent protoporphyrinogen oxidase